MPRRRRFQRPPGKRRYRKLFVIACEGEKTEPQYFFIFNDPQSVISVRCISKARDSSPPQVLRRLKEHLSRERLRPSDEAWLVVDKDMWTDGQLEQLHAWSLERSNYGFALSNPKFEYWLLLHFEDGRGITSSRVCTERLRRHLPDLSKGIDVRKITRERVDDAIHRARARDVPPCNDWPRDMGRTTVYKLVESIRKSEVDIP